jgi:hypothetical protein
MRSANDAKGIVRKSADLRAIGDRVVTAAASVASADVLA